MNRTINDWCRLVHEEAVAKGWYDDVPDPHDPVWKAARLALIHSEVSEALECVRTGATGLGLYDHAPGIQRKPVGEPSELADIAIRLFDYAASIGVDLEAAIDAKVKYNATRPRRHGGKAL